MNETQKNHPNKKMINNNDQTNNQITKLETAIARSRQRLQSLWDAKGYTDAEVLNASIELDLLINEYLRRCGKD